MNAAIVVREVEEFLMVLLRASMILGLLFAVQALAAEPAPQRTQSPRIHYTACSLGESMASKLAAKKMSAEDAQRTCQQLAPSMTDAEHAEFMRCCTTGLKR
jgi:hypothetical protein